MSQPIGTIDGVAIYDYKQGAKICGCTYSGFVNAWTGYHKDDDVFTVKGHIVKRAGQALEIEQSKKEITAEEKQLIALEEIKEQLRYLRECLIGRLHGLDEIAENVRVVERRLIESKDKIKSSYHGATDHQAERLG